MRAYASSKLRICLMIGLVATAVFVLAGKSFGQATGTPDANAPKAPDSLWAVIMSNKDPVFFTILGLSIVGMTLIIQGVIKNRASVFMPDETTDTIREMIGQRKFKELIEFTETDPSFISRALNPALKRAPSFSSMKEAMETAIGEQTAEQFRRIEYLNIIGNLGPLLGLLGTVLGMIDAFTHMSSAGAQGASPAVLAGGISKALCHTMLGLILAVPCLAAFGILRTVVDRLTVRGALVAEELLLMIKPAEAKPAAAGAVRPGAVPQPGPRKIPTPAPATQG
jgi:biopolymer transport protein ExbB